ncbi:MAG TPA: hypothetical protein DCP25_09995 [Chloroflexi bacterium]|nr:hypothetical protein [Chloroflexota bacterium]
MTARLDNREVGSVTSQLQNAGQCLNLGAVQLRRGTHRVSLIVSLRSLRPGTGGDGFPLGPLLLQPSTRGELLAPARATTLCGRTLDWLEVLAR